MADQAIRPERITKPIQLLAAWLAGLVLVDGAFLGAASMLTQPSWGPGLLIIASVVNVPLFISALFLLQTRFRPEMQEDTYYSQYLERRYASSSVSTVDISEASKDLAGKILKQVGPGPVGSGEAIEELIRTSKLQDLASRFALSRTLAELYVRPQLWPKIVDRWRDSPEFRGDLIQLRDDGLLDLDASPEHAALTDLGRNVAEFLKSRGSLWHQSHQERWRDEELKVTAGPLPKARPNDA